MPAEKWLVYMILASDRSLYTGITTDIKRRWRQHSGHIKGGARFFRGRKPLKLVYIETSSNRSSASRREAEIKKLSRQQKLALFSSCRNQSEYWSKILYKNHTNE